MKMNRLSGVTSWNALLMLCLAGCFGGSAEQRAGYAYTENDEGELVELDGARATHSTPAASKNKGSRDPGEDVDWLESFELTERSGETVTSEQLKGKPYVTSFFFSLCPTICVNQNGKVQSLQEKFAGEPVRFVSISCDPEVDRPEVLAEYAQRFDADDEQWLFLTGELDYIRRVGAEMYQLPVARRFHAEKFVLVDAEGEIVAFYTWTEPEQWLALQRDIRRIIDAGGTLEDGPSVDQQEAE
jgi:protein SCO1